MNMKVRIMKTKVLIIAFALLIMAIIAFGIYSWPVKIQENLDGITYRSNISGYSKEMNLIMDGHYYRNLFKQNEFLGKFYIEGIELPENLKQNGSINIYFDKNNQGSLYYQNIELGDGSDWFFVAAVYMDIKGKRVAVTIHEGAGTGSSQWSSAGGLIFAAPAKNRAEAIFLTNDLMEYWLKKPIR